MENKEELLKLEIEKLKLENENLKLNNKNNINKNEEIELLRTIAKPMKSFEENKTEARNVLITIYTIAAIGIIIGWILIFTWL
ncbi:hypothetical protein N5U31_06465 [Aliarcobacter butzleri]|uniref:hypothetical protein n=1 Tax=Aliarcobacter TaxID=2321111 RepID=UPI0008305425|nr:MULTISPECIES: hypothetical protein [Aliarcobacter]MCT7592610.1 hypothetical protein [Aliarcobacter butzleri]